MNIKFYMVYDFKVFRDNLYIYVDRYIQYSQHSLYINLSISNDFPSASSTIND